MNLHCKQTTPHGQHVWMTGGGKDALVPMSVVCLGSPSLKGAK